MDKKGKEGKGRAGRGGGTLNIMMKSVLMALLASVLTALTQSVLISRGILPEGSTEGYAAFACALGALIGGGYAVRKTGKKTLIVGLGIGVLLFLIFGVLGTLGSGGRAEWGSDLALIAGACLCGGGISGVLGGIPRKRRG